MCVWEKERENVLSKAVDDESYKGRNGVWVANGMQRGPCLYKREPVQVNKLDFREILLSMIQAACYLNARKGCTSGT